MTGPRGKAALAYLAAKNKKAEEDAKYTDPKSVDDDIEMMLEVKRKCETGELTGSKCPVPTSPDSLCGKCWSRCPFDNAPMCINYYNTEYIKKSENTCDECF